MPAKIYNDDVLLKMLAANDGQALNIIYKKHYGHLLNLINNIIHDKEISKDIVQDLFCTLWERRHSLKITKPVKAYLIKAAIHRSWNFMRDNTRYEVIRFQEQEMLQQLKNDNSSVGALELEELRKLLKSAILSMPAKSKVAYILNRKHKMTYQEIATLLGISQKAVEKRISRSLKHLNIILKPYLKGLLLLMIM